MTSRARDGGGGANSVLALIPARGGSKGIARKNLQTVDGISLVGRAVLHARRFMREVGLSDARIIVDTDDAEIAAEGRRWGGEVPFLRPPELATDSTTTIASTLCLLNRLADAGWHPNSVILLQPTSPLRSWRDIAACWHAYRERTHAAVVSAVAANKPPQLAMCIAADGTVDWLAETPLSNARRQDLISAVHANGAVYVIAAETLRRTGQFVLPGKTRAVVAGSVTSLDVDDPADLLMARRLALFVGDARSSGMPLLRVVRTEADGVSVAPSDQSSPPIKLPVFDQDRLADVADRLLADHPPGVLLRPTRTGIGPATWRELLGCPVGMLLDPTKGAWLPLTIISADFLAVPIDAAAASAPLVGMAAALLADARDLRSEPGTSSAPLIELYERLA